MNYEEIAKWSDIVSAILFLAVMVWLWTKYIAPAVLAAQEGLALAERGLRATVAYYPNCRLQVDRNVALPLLILIGDKDDWTPADRCRQLQAEAPRRDLIEAVYYPGATHGFDQEGRDRRVMGIGGAMHLMSYDAAVTADAEARTKAWFGKYLK